MLGMKTYDQDYIDACRARVDAGVRAHRKSGAKDKEFESRFFNDQVLLLDYMFVHRLSGQEGKDGNALNEVRVLCQETVPHAGAPRRICAASEAALPPAPSSTTWPRNDRTSSVPRVSATISAKGTSPFTAPRKATWPAIHPCQLRGCPRIASPSEAFLGPANSSRAYRSVRTSRLLNPRRSADHDRRNFGN